MSAELIGAIKQLVAILRRYWSLSGQPPERQTWTFPLPPEFINYEEWSSKREGSYTHDNAYFEALATNSSDPLIAEAIANIPALSEIAKAISDIKISLESNQANGSERLRYLFGNLCQKEWSGTFCISESMNLDCVDEFRAKSTIVGYSFRVVEEQFLVDLLAASEEVRSGVPQANSSLTEREETVLEAIGDSEMSAEELAVKAGYPCNSAFRSLLSGMKKRSLLNAGRGGNGYRKSPSQ
jgi:hypothetical protein